MINIIVKIFRSLRLWLRTDFGLKIFSVCIALILWLYATGLNTSDVVFEVPLEIHNIPTNYIITGDVVTTVTVRLNGQSDVVKALRVREIKAHLDLKFAQRGRNVYELTPSDILIPQGVKVTGINPKKITINLDLSNTNAINNSTK